MSVLFGGEITVEGRVSLSVLAIYPDEDVDKWRRTKYTEFMINAYDKGQTLTNEKLYDLKASPTLYLLDRDQRVILKDVNIEKIEWHLTYLI